MPEYERYAEYKDSGIEWLGEIPVHWNVKRIKSVVTIDPRVDVQHLEPKDQVNFLPMEALKTNNTFEIRLKPLEEVIYGYSYFADNDVVMAKVTPCFENHKAALVNDLSNGIGFGTTEITTLRSKGTILPSFLYYLISTPVFKEEGKKSFKGVGGLQRIASNFVPNYTFALPPLDEQQKIVDFLDAECARIDGLIADLEALVRLLEEKRSVLVSEVVSRGIPGTHENFVDSGLKRLESICHIVTGKADALGDINGRYPLFTCSDEVRSSNSYSFESDSILISGNGKFDVKKFNGKFEAYQRTYVITPKNNDFNSDFLYWIIDNKIDSMQKSGSSNGSIIKFLKLKQIHDIEIPNILPKDQEKFYHFLNHEVNKIDESIILLKKARLLTLEKKCQNISCVVTGTYRIESVK